MDDHVPVPLNANEIQKVMLLYNFSKRSIQNQDVISQKQYQAHKWHRLCFSLSESIQVTRFHSFSLQSVTTYLLSWVITGAY